MAHLIDDKVIENVSILAQLELTEEEKEAAKEDMSRMLAYIDKLNELDTENIEPMSHIFPIHNVFREDIVENGDDRENMLKNAPESKDGAFKVPKTVE
jgi:aspartyl-tRNA(Asn)/glutamyl-tRNA(Gln) amidotransferase subunit C